MEALIGWCSLAKHYHWESTKLRTRKARNWLWWLQNWQRKYCSEGTAIVAMTILGLSTKIQRTVEFYLFRNFYIRFVLSKANLRCVEIVNRLNRSALRSTVIDQWDQNYKTKDNFRIHYDFNWNFRTSANLKTNWYRLPNSTVFKYVFRYFRKTCL